MWDAISDGKNETELHIHINTSIKTHIVLFVYKEILSFGGLSVPSDRHISSPTTGSFTHVFCVCMCVFVFACIQDQYTHTHTHIQNKDFPFCLTLIIT